MNILGQAKSSAEGTIALAIVVAAGLAVYYMVKGASSLSDSVSQGMQSLGSALSDPFGTVAKLFPINQGKTSNAKSMIDLANVDENGTLSVPVNVDNKTVDVQIPGMAGVAGSVYDTGDPYNEMGAPGTGSLRAQWEQNANDTNPVTLPPLGT